MTGNSRNKKFQKLRPNNKGQVLIESLLLMVLSFGLLGATLKYFRDTKTFSNITNVVWAGVAQMAEYGNWPGTKNVHPNASVRVRLRDPEK